MIIVDWFLAATKQLYERFSPSVRQSEAGLCATGFIYDDAVNFTVDVRHTILAVTKQL